MLRPPRLGTQRKRPHVKAITVRQPYADAIAHGSRSYGRKLTENRTRPTQHRGPVLIHAGLAEYQGAVLVRDHDWPDVRGAVIAVAEIVGCHQANTDGPLCCAPWGFPDHWHWELDHVRPLPKPVPARGQLGLWTPPADVLAAVEAQYATMEGSW